MQLILFTLCTFIIVKPLGSNICIPCLIFYKGEIEEDCETPWESSGNMNSDAMSLYNNGYPSIIFDYKHSITSF